MGHSDKPTETTSKKQVSRIRQVTHLESQKNHDPRFSSLSGTFNRQQFNASYGFIKQIEKDQLLMVKESCSKEQNEDKKEKLAKLHQSLASKIKTDELRDKKDLIKREWKREQAQNVKRGGQAYHLKDSDLKKIQLIEKFNKMKPKEMTSFLEKKRKRNAADEHKYIPRQRNGDK